MKKRMTNESIRFLSNEIQRVLGKDLEKLNEDILEGYDSLSTYAYDPGSQSNPDIYRNLFQERLESFEYFQKDKNGFTLSLPDIESFDFTGMEVLLNILNGTMGEYYEISARTARLIDETSILERSPLSTITEEPYFLIEDTENLHNKVKALTGQELVRFPFSNIPSLEAVVFDPVAKFEDENDTRIGKIVSDSVKLIAQKFGGKPA